MLLEYLLRITLFRLLPCCTVIIVCIFEDVVIVMSGEARSLHRSVVICHSNRHPLGYQSTRTDESSQKSRLSSFASILNFV
ncbi:hypothetical protein Y032_0024g927 [Ancylostoma ceylanicum]|uniref:Uncharacterized protein n=1 Tax=Ancylostoma ceylanicum TaxID=53326 RepID=A0A016UYM7_9BILA|nr:hypothetical protein Y032_0024g927 [Ancylostoma ceylanicum]